ncbi:MAG: LysM domain-containing protein [Ilumatobacter sp.]|uniref:LysM peptidoglycan-binding domain-containing protein n=1 Tax=Ilumatobacter sp. TaxID=1967498 RepID=UPI003C76CBF2
MSSDGATGGRRSFEALGVGATAIAVGIVVSVGLAACGTTDEASRMTLPPLETTTTTTTTTTTIPFERFYEIQPGDSLSAIAAAKGVSVVEILNANPQLQGEDSIQAGQTIEIPATTITTPVDTEPAP